jgi:hypothetical protein
MWVKQEDPFKNDTLNLYATRYNKKTGIYTKQVLNTGHIYGNIQNKTEIDKKGKHLNSLEEYHIYHICQENKPVNKTLIHNTNPIFDVIHKHYINK